MLSPPPDLQYSMSRRRFFPVTTPGGTTPWRPICNGARGEGEREREGRKMWETNHVTDERGRAAAIKQNRTFFFFQILCGKRRRKIFWGAKGRNLTSSTCPRTSSSSVRRGRLDGQLNVNEERRGVFFPSFLPSSQCSMYSSSSLCQPPSECTTLLEWSDQRSEKKNR